MQHDLALEEDFDGFQLNEPQEIKELEENNYGFHQINKPQRRISKKKTYGDIFFIIQTALSYADEAYNYAKNFYLQDKNTLVLLQSRLLEVADIMSETEYFIDFTSDSVWAFIEELIRIDGADSQKLREMMNKFAPDSERREVISAFYEIPLMEKKCNRPLNGFIWNLEIIDWISEEIKDEDEKQDNETKKYEEEEAKENL